MSCPRALVAIRTQAATKRLSYRQVIGEGGSVLSRNQLSSRGMATVKGSVPHVVRTATDQREKDNHETVLSRIEIVNSRIRLLRLSLENGPARHLPGQYVDLQIPGIETVGGFTITSPPQAAATSRPSAPPEGAAPYIELAIQRSDNNPPAAYLYRDPSAIIGAPMSIRVGGSFTYPPLSLSRDEYQKVDTVVFIAGGVGINPIMSMVSALDILRHARPNAPLPKVRILYSSRREYQEKDRAQIGEEILFEKRLAAIAERWKNSNKDMQWKLFETSSSSGAKDIDMGHIHHLFRRMEKNDVLEAIGSEKDRAKTLVYVCGLPSMTDLYVEYLKNLDGLDEKRVLCEKWW